MHCPVEEWQNSKQNINRHSCRHERLSECSDLQYSIPRPCRIESETCELSAVCCSLSALWSLLSRLIKLM